MPVEDFKKADGNWAKGSKVGGTQTVSGSKYWAMATRCSPGYADVKPCYAGCSMSPLFKDFQKFVEWHRSQAGYGLGYDLDKDLIVPGNKVYGEGTCVLIPRALNTWATQTASKRGEYPQGVSYDKFREKYKAHIKPGPFVNVKSRYLGRFDTAAEAAEVYNAEKDAQAYGWYLRLCSGEFDVDRRVLEAMLTWNTKERFKHGNA